jgi:uncharacterized membrane protein
MRKRKWFIPAVLLPLLVIGGIAGGMVALADDSSINTADQVQAAGRHQLLLDRACAIYEEETGVAIDSEQLRAALRRARSEMQDEALENRLQNLVSEGKITQEEADQYLEWWQSRPGIVLPMPGFGGQGRRGGMMWGNGF